LNRLRGLSAELQDVAYELRSYLDELEADPNRLEVVEDRIQALRALERKYGPDVEAYMAEAQARLSRLENFEEETAGLEGRIRQGETELEMLGETLRRGARGRRRSYRGRCKRTSEI
jgi:DNA repair protein RecN (Recombination protein N)